MLFRKLWRDIRNNYGAYLACCSVVMIGLAIYVSFSIIVDNLNSSLNAYYQEYGFADGYARLTAGPPQLADRLKSIPGIDKATARYVRDVLLHRSSGEDITTLRLISYQQGHQPLNRFRLTAGRLPVPGQRELLVSPAFFKANHFRLGQSIPLIINGREVLFAITGTAISPEFVYEISEKGSMYPNPVTFGVAWVPERSLATLPGFGGMINELAFSLKPGVKFSQVKGPVGKLLEPFGLTAVFSAEDQLSNLIVQQKLDGIEKMARSVPIMFLMIAAAILYIMLRRMVEQQRGQIGILKAFGFGNASIILHYLWYAWLIGLFGGLIGGLLGALLSVSLADLYREYFNIPGFQGGIDYRYLAGG
ncbi:MAG TPA: FtsX-like permease family protein, partial [Bacillota bacterium]|nr:FtsX-like permease family protein [Bacillota bacterium]